MRNIAVNDPSEKAHTYKDQAAINSACLITFTTYALSVWRFLERLKYKLRAQHNTQSYILTFPCEGCS